MTELDEMTAERDAWRAAAILYRRIAADSVLRLKDGLTYAKAQSLYTEALKAQPDGGPTEETP